MPNARPDFASSPRPPLPTSTVLVSLMRRNGLVAACIARAERNTRTYYRANDAVWQWLFRPELPPSQDERR